MKTIILPGFSPGNKDWAEEIKSQLNLSHPVLVHYWKHWETGTSNLSVKYEVSEIIKEIGKEDVNILAKSVGTMVSMHLLDKLKGQVKKIVFCGVPSVSEQRLKLYKKALSGFPSEKIVCYQNEKDPWANFSEVKTFLGKINPKIRVIKKERKDHHYPYPEDFQNFIVS